MALLRASTGRVRSPPPDLVVSDRRYRHADDHTVFARCTIRMERDTAGRPAGQFVHIADLTRLRQTEDAVATSEARFRRAFDEAPIGMALGSADSRLMWVNDAFCACCSAAPGSRWWGASPPTSCTPTTYARPRISSPRARATRPSRSGP